MNRVSARDIRQSYTSEKVRTDLRSHLWAYLVLRPLSFYITPLFVGLGFSANAVTVLGLITLVCGLVLIVSGATSSTNFVIGAILINIVYLLDCVDGNIARFRGKHSKFGALFDSIVGLAFSSCLPLSLGLGLYLASPEQVMLPLGIELPRWCWLVAGALQSSSRLFRRVVSLKSGSGVEGPDGKQDHPDSFTWAILPRAIPSFESPLLLVAALVGALRLFLIAYAAYDLLSLLAVVALSLRGALRFDRRQLESGRK